MTKKEIIDIADDFVNNSAFKSVIKKDDDKSNEKKHCIGTNQFRSIASVCNEAECYEEIEILIKYNTAKDNYGIWAKIQDKLLKTMEEIKNKDNQNVLKNLNLFFGYLYRYGRILTSNSKER